MNIRRLWIDLKLGAETKLNVKIDLDEWSFCIVFSPLWCDNETIPNNRTALSLLRYLVNNPSDILSSFNKKENSASIDFSLLYYLSSTFKQPKISQIDSFYKLGELNNFNIVLRAFKEY